MVDKEYIRKRHFVDGWSIRKLSESCKISRQTVRKMLADAEVPKYQLSKQRPRPAMERWIPVIESWLREEGKFPKKQRYVSSRIYERLQEDLLIMKVYLARGRLGLNVEICRHFFHRGSIRWVLYLDFSFTIGIYPIYTLQMYGGWDY